MPTSSMRLVAALCTVALLAGGCGGEDELASEELVDGIASTSEVSGPLCEALPRGEEPGAPSQLETETATVALTWIPVIMNFEAAVRAAGLDEELAEVDGVTILAPTDEAFEAAMSRDTIDDLLLNRNDELRALLEAHIVDQPLTVEEMEQAGTITMRSGDEFAVVPVGGGMVRIDERSETVCADYRVANARIHVVDGVLGELPEPAEQEEPVTGGG